MILSRRRNSIARHLTRMGGLLMRCQQKNLLLRGTHHIASSPSRRSLVPLFLHIRIGRLLTRSCSEETAVLRVATRRDGVPAAARDDFWVDRVEKRAWNFGHLTVAVHLSVIEVRMRLGSIDDVAAGAVRRCYFWAGGTQLGRFGGMGRSGFFFPLRFGDKEELVGDIDASETDVHDTFCELGDERVASGNVLSLPAPSPFGKHVEGKPDVLYCSVARDVLTLGHLTVEDDHSGDMKGDRRCEEGNIWNVDEFVVDNDYVMGRDHG
jgi:hypothetical protein